MTTANNARKAHKILDDLLKGNIVLDEEREFLCNALPELPKQKTLEEIIVHVNSALFATGGSNWPAVSYGSLEDWLCDLREQLCGLKDTPASSPALPAGMRLADHKGFGRVVVTDWIDSDNEHFCVFRSDNLGYGTYAFLPKESLTFIDTEPANPAPAHPELLETEADYQKAPEGTIVALDGSGTIWLKKFGAWRNTAGDHGVKCIGLALDPRRVLRWGWGK